MHKTKYYSISVPTKSYLKKFIIGRYGDPLHVGSNSLLGVMIYNMANNNVFSRIEKNERDQKIKLLNDEILFLLPASWMYIVGSGIDPDAVIQLNRFFTNLFEDDLYNFCKKTIKEKIWRPGYDKAIELFAAKYSIELGQDINFETLKKSEFRYRKKHEKISFRFVLSQTVPQQGTIF